MKSNLSLHWLKKHSNPNIEVIKKILESVCEMSTKCMCLLRAPKKPQIPERPRNELSVLNDSYNPGPTHGWGCNPMVNTHL